MDRAHGGVGRRIRQDGDQVDRVIHNIFDDTRGRYHRRRMEVLENSRKYKNTLLQTSGILDGLLDIVIPLTFDLLSEKISIRHFSEFSFFSN